MTRTVVYFTAPLLALVGCASPSPTPTVSFAASTRSAAAPTPADAPSASAASSATSSAAPASSAVPAKLATRAFYSGYSGGQPIEAWLTPSAPGEFSGEITGLSAHSLAMHAKYGEWREVSPGTLPSGVASYSGELSGTALDAGWLFDLWREPDADPSQKPTAPPQEILNNSAGNSFWLTLVGDEHAATEHRRLASALIHASGSKPGPCGLEVAQSSQLSTPDGLRVTGFFVGDPCPTRAHRDPAHAQLRYPWQKRFFAVASDAHGVMGKAMELGAPTSDDEGSMLMAVDLPGAHIFGVRRDWAKREGGPAAATADAWLLASDDKLQLTRLLSLGHWDINQTDSPKNGIAEVFALPADSGPARDVAVLFGDALSVYRLEASGRQLSRASKPVSPEIRARLASAKSSW